MMSRPQKYTEGEALDSRHAKSNRGLMLRVAVLVVCVLLVSAFVVTYLLFELLKTREMLRNLELKEETVKTDVTVEPYYKCEDGWEQHGGKCYYFSTRKSSWDVSSTECSTKGGDLVKIDSREEQSFLRKNVQQKLAGYDDLFWIGLKASAEEGRWLWVDSSPLDQRLTLWKYQEADDLSGEDPDGDNCVGMGPMYWFDNSCKVPQRSICEKPALILCA